LKAELLSLRSMNIFTLIVSIGNIIYSFVSGCRARGLYTELPLHN